jgi:hypothetical protein
MILDLADIRITAGRQADFDAVIPLGGDTVLSNANCFRGYKIDKASNRLSAIC